MTDLLYLLLAIFGAFVGFLYVTFSWRGKPQPKGRFRDDPRLHGLYWGAWGAFLIFIADWRRISQVISDDEAFHVSRFVLLLCYLGGFLISLFISLFTFSAKIAFDAYQLNKRHGRNIYAIDGASPVMDFLLYGYREYQDRYSKAMNRHREESKETVQHEEAEGLRLAIRQQQELIDIREDELDQRRRLSRETSEILITAIDLYRGFVFEKVNAREACRRMLKPIASLAAYFTGVNSAKINVNYMVVQYAEALTEEEIKSAKFTYGDPSRYTCFLALRDYARAGTNFIRLPVEPMDDHSWQERTLPGAPEAFLRRGPTVCNKRDLTFGAAVPQEIRAAQLKYFLMQPFDTVISLPLIPTLNYTEDGSPIGILNLDLGLDGGSLDIEEAHEDIKELEALLSPLNVLMADILISEAPFSRSKL